MRLFLMRHAEAQEKIDIDDFSRVLTEKGMNEASIAAEFLQAYQIDKILVSDAKRTIQTAETIHNKIKCSNYEILPELYASSSEKIIEIISRQDDIDKNLLIIAHNPGIFNAALYLLDDNSPEYDSLIDSGMTTAKIVIVDLKELKNWRDV